MDEDEPLNPRPHIIYTKDNDKSLYYDGFGFIPFFRIDANRKQRSHLHPIKALIDDYDLMACGLSNNLQDVSEALYVVKGFQGDNLEEIIQNVKTKKHIGVEPDGDVDIKTIDLPYQARMNKLEVDEKNIYRFGMGFNTAYNNGFLGSMYDMQGQGVPLIIPIDERQVLTAVQKTGDDFKLSNKLGVSTKKLKEQVKQELVRGLASQLTYQQIARNISDYGQSDMHRSMNIARTEGHRVQNQARFDSMNDSVDMSMQWVMAMKNLTG